MPCCRGLGRSFRYLKTAVHIGVDGAENDGMDHYSLASQDCSQRLRHVQRGCLRNGVRGYNRQRCKRHQREIVDDGTFGSVSAAEEKRATH